MIMESKILVIYDCEDDNVRLGLSEICQDYGLKRIQFSAFLGDLPATLWHELFEKLCDKIDDHPARLLVQPICLTDAQKALFKNVDKAKEA